MFFPPVLNGHWYDSCANLPASPSRRLGYQFPDIYYFNTPKPTIIARAGLNITLKSLRECNNYTLGKRLLAFCQDTHWV